VRSSALRLLALSAVAAGVLATVPPGPASSTPIAPAAHHRAHVDHVDHGGHAPKPAASELTMEMRDLFVARSDFGGVDRMRASEILSRPTDGPSDPQDEGYDQPSKEICNHRICVHYVTKGSDAPRNLRWVRHTLHVMTAVWHHEIGVLGFRKPPTDGHRGGDSRFDVYLTDLGSRGLFGYCTPERRVLGEKYGASGYCVLDNDFAKKQYDAPREVSLKVTAAHEFFHAIQFGYNYRADPWLMESTAVWMEESFADKADDNRRYLPYGQVARPWVPLDKYSDTGYSQYGNWAFWEYLTDHYGSGIVKAVWDQADATHGGPGRASIPALAYVLNHTLHTKHGLAEALTDFAVANLDPTKSYPEGSAWPKPAFAAHARMRRTAGVRTDTVRVKHLAAQDVVFRPPSKGAARRVRLTVDGPAQRDSVVVTVTHANGRLSHRTITLHHGVGTAVVDFSPGVVRSAIVTVVNTSSRYTCDRGTLLSCGGVPKDNGMRFTVSARALPTVAVSRSRRSHH